MKFSKLVFIPKSNSNNIKSSNENIFSTKIKSEVNCNLEDFAEKLFFEFQEINKLAKSFKNK